MKKRNGQLERLALSIGYSNTIVLMNAHLNCELKIENLIPKNTNSIRSKESILRHFDRFINLALDDKLYIINYLINRPRISDENYELAIVVIRKLNQ